MGEGPAQRERAGLLGERFRLIRLLGSGGAGEVHLAEDLRAPGTRVALKLARAPAATAHAARTEFGHLARLRHPHLLRALDFGRLPDGRLFLCTRFVEGEDLRLWAKRHDDAEVGQVLVQVCRALDHLHRREIVHGDLKPENILVEEGPNAVVVDLGLALSARAPSPRGLSGTLGYLAPEVLAGSRPTPATDLYSLGATLRDVLPPSSRLLELSRWLMAQSPGERPGSAPAVIEAIHHRLGLEVTLSPVARAGRYFLGAPHVARTDELERVCAARQGLFVVRGGPGLGKSRFLVELRVRLLLQGRDCVLRAGSAWAGPMRAAWPALRLGPVAETEEETALDRVVDRLAEAISRRARSGTRLALLLDDLPLDDALESRALRRLSTLPVLCCATVPDSAWTDEHQTLCREGAGLIQLRGLTLSEAGELLGGLAPEKEHPAETVAEICSATEGNPRLTEELVRSVLESGTGDHHLLGSGDLMALARQRLARLRGELRVELLALSPFVHGAPPSLIPGLVRLRERALVLETEGLVRMADPWLREALLAELGPEERRSLHLEAARQLASFPLRSPTLELERAEQLALAGLTLSAAECFAEVAQRHASSVLDGSLARLCYRRSLSLIQTCDDRRRARPLERRALGELGRLCRVSGDYAEARALQLQLLDLAAGDRAAEGEARLALAETSLAEGKGGEALPVLETLSAEAEGELQGRADAVWARALIHAGRYAEAELRARRALANGAPASLQADLENMIGLSQMMTGAPREQTLASLDRAISLHGERGDLGGLARASNSRAILLQRAGDLEGAVLAYRQCLDTARELGDLQLQIIYTLNLATAAHELRRYGEALSAYREGLALAQSIGHEREVARASANLGNLMLQLGDLGEASGLLSRAAEIAQRLGLEDLDAHLMLFSAELALHQQNLDRASELAATASTRFADLGLEPSAAEAMILGARARLEAGDPAEAERLAARACTVGLSRPLLARARLIEGTAAMRAASPEAERVRDRLEECCLLARRSGALDVLSLAHCLLFEVSQTPAESAHHAERAGRAREALLASMPAPYRALCEGVHLGAASPPAPPRAERTTTRGTLDLLRINRELTREHRPQSILELILDRSIELTGAERGFLILAPDLRVAAARNLDQVALRRREFKFSRSLAEQVVHSGEPIVTGSATEDERFRQARSVHQLQLRSVVCLPLHAPQRVLGALYLDNRFQHGAFSPDEIEILQAFADQAAIALANAELLEQAQARAGELADAKNEVERLNAQLRETVTAQAERIDEMAARLGSDQEELLHRYRAARLRGRSKAICDILRMVDRVAATDVPVLLQGETGTGKEVVAKAIHCAGTRHGGPFVSVNCAAIPGPLLESELFGHARGAFTGALRDRSGLFQMARGGTLLLDEVGDMPLEMQAKLLRVLQEGKFRRIGEEHERTTDARIVSASLHDLAALVEAGRFRQDLYFRLNVVQISIPPLRDRPEDIPELVDYTLGEMDPRPRIEPAAMALLLRHSWPGNVRELQNELRRAAALGDGTISAQALSPRISQRSTPVDGVSLEGAIASAEKEAIERALERTSGSATRAAQLLGISRVVLHRKIRKHDIQRVRRIPARQW